MNTHTGRCMRRGYPPPRNRDDMGKSPAIISCGSPPIVHAPLPSPSSLRGRFGSCGGREDGDANGGSVKSLSVISSVTALRKGSRSGMLAISQSRYASGKALRSWPLYLPNGISILPTCVTRCGHHSEGGLRGQASLNRNIHSHSDVVKRFCVLSSCVFQYRLGWL